MIAQSLKDRFPASHRILLENLEQILSALSRNSEPMVQFRTSKDSIEFYNGYIDFALAVYVDKFKQLYEALAESLDRERYIVYAHLGRAIIENAATLRYFASQEEFTVAHKVQHNEEDGDVLRPAIKN